MNNPFEFHKYQADRYILARQHIAIRIHHNPANEKPYSFSLEWLPDPLRVHYVWHTQDETEYKTHRGVIKGSERVLDEIAIRISRSCIKV
jgi:hypothetical protein